MVDINELEFAGSDSRINIVAQAGRMSGQYGDDTSDGDWTGVRRYYLTKDNDRSKIKSHIVENLGKRDMESWKELAEFIIWANKNYPAQKYALIMWDHSNGWKPVD